MPPVTTTAFPPITTEPPAPPVTERPSTLVVPDIEPAVDELVKVSDFIPSIYVDLRYASSNNLAGIKIYSYSDAYLRYGTVQRLAAVQEELLESGYALLIWDAFRPVSAQFTLSGILPEKASSPINKTVAYNHGAALSVSIIASDGTPLPIPYDFDCSDRPSDYDNSSKAAANADLLSQVMKRHGFVPYLSQWYRYTDQDAYTTDPALTIGSSGIESCPEWTVICDDYLTLRRNPDQSAEALIRLNRGQKVKLISFIADFACVEVNGRVGYVLAAYIGRTENGSYQEDLSTVQPQENYSYEQMQTDLQQLAQAYPSLLHLSSIGFSEEGRELTLAILGNENANRKIFLQAAIHAREYMVTEITMAQIDYMLTHQSEQLPDSELTIGELLTQVCFHIVPMSNPDGVVIVQSGKIPAAFSDRYPDNIATIWKANAKGIDLNANFDADWENYGSKVNEPAYMSYKGSSPECAAESKALADYLRANQFDLILSYHTSGSVIYWSFGGNECAEVNRQNYDLACQLSVGSGFTVSKQASTSTAGLKDWAITALKTPSLTIEFAAASSPIMQREFDQIWARGRDMLSVCGRWVLDQQ